MSQTPTTSQETDIAHCGAWTSQTAQTSSSSSSVPTQVNKTTNSSPSNQSRTKKPRKNNPNSNTKHNSQSLSHSHSGLPPTTGITNGNHVNTKPPSQSSAMDRWLSETHADGPWSAF